LVGKAYIVAALDRWVLGEKIYGRKRGEFLDRLKPPPPDVWEIRVTVPAIQARMFGRFAEPDTLILTKFHTRAVLGDWPAPGSADTELGVFMGPEVSHGETEVYTRVQA
jgi:hypothetical protein